MGVTYILGPVQCKGETRSQWNGNKGKAFILTSIGVLVSLDYSTPVKVMKTQNQSEDPQREKGDGELFCYIGTVITKESKKI